MESTTFNLNSTMYTPSVSGTTTSTKVSVILWTAQMQKFAIVVVNPLLAMVGLAGNLLSILVLAKSGLKKPSNILLASLCVADSLCLISALNIPAILTYFPNKSPTEYQVWEYPKDVCYSLYILAILFQFCYFIGILVSASVVILITFERLLAVYYPLQFKLIVTRNRTWLAVVLVYIFWIPFPVYVTLFFSFYYAYVDVWDVSFGQILFQPDSTVIIIEAVFLRPVGLYAPVVLIAVGSLLIALRVRVTTKKRQKIVSQRGKTSMKTTKTTTTLLTVCVVFIATKSVTFFLNIIDFKTVDKEVQSLRIFVSILSGILFNINSASNFVIYVALNKKFRQNFQKIIKYKRK